MTEEQKEILIAKMLDDPSSLSDEELDSILRDDELRDLYEASAALSNACIRQPEFDMNEEWKRFRRRTHRKPSKMRWVMRVAAIFSGVVLASGIVVKIIDNVFTGEQPSAIAKTEHLPKASDAPVAIPDQQAAEEEIEDAEKEPAIEKRHASEVGRNIAQAEMETQKSETAETQIENDIDIEEYLRVQQACIDNDLAVQVAESYAEEYDNLVPLLDAVSMNSQALDNMIRKVTME